MPHLARKVRFEHAAIWARLGMIGALFTSFGCDVIPIGVHGNKIRAGEETSLGREGAYFPPQHTDQIIVVSRSSDLPPCDETTQDIVYNIESERAFVFCNGTDWIELDLDPGDIVATGCGQSLAYSDDLAPGDQCSLGGKQIEVWGDCNNSGLIEPEFDRLLHAQTICSLSTPGQSWQDMTLYLSPNGTDNDQCSSDNPCRSVNQALAKVPKAIGHSVVLELQPGTYSESIHIDDFIVNQSGQLLIRGSSGQSLIDAGLIHEHALAITNSRGSAGGRIVIHNLEFTKATSAGIFIDDSTNVYLGNISSSNNGSEDHLAIGIWVTNRSTVSSFEDIAEMSQHVVASSNTGSGFFIDHNSNATFHRLTSIDNGTGSIGSYDFQDGVSVQNLSRLTISRLERIDGNQGHGLKLTHHSDANITGWIEINEDTGELVDGASIGRKDHRNLGISSIRAVESQLTMSDVFMITSNNHGLSAESSSLILLANVAISDNIQDGVRAVDNATIKIRDSVIEDNGNVGAYLYKSLVTIERSGSASLMYPPHYIFNSISNNAGFSAHVEDGRFVAAGIDIMCNLVNEPNADSFGTITLERANVGPPETCPFDGSL